MIRSDEQIKKDIVDELCWDTRIDASKVNVTVKNGAVTLGGEVPGYNDIMAARAAAWRIKGVVDVADSLKIVYVSPPALPNDAEIQTRASDLLAWGPAIDEAEITLSVDNGVVTMEGTVDAYWKKPFAENMISGIRGIMSIHNRLVIVPSMKIADEVIARDVMAALERDMLVDPEKITVVVNDGIVTLSGSVPDWAARLAAEDDALYTAGVTSLRSRLSIAT